MSKRLEVLQKMIAAGSVDPFARYALALELKQLGRLEESLATFTDLRTFAPSYVPQYLMAGGVAEISGRKDIAREWFEEGIRIARAAGNAHAVSELEQALAVVVGT